MTGPEHYREAEKLMALDERIREQGGDPGDLLHAAQVHATLALAAATGLPQQRILTLADLKAWSWVAGEKHQEEGE